MEVVIPIKQVFKHIKFLIYYYYSLKIIQFNYNKHITLQVIKTHLIIPYLIQNNIIQFSILLDCIKKIKFLIFQYFHQVLFLYDQFQSFFIQLEICFLNKLLIFNFQSKPKNYFQRQNKFILILKTIGFIISLVKKLFIFSLHYN